MIYDIVIVGCGAAGLFVGSVIASTLNKGLKILVLEKKDSIAKKLLISGSSQCNFTNFNNNHKLNEKELLSNFSNHYGDNNNFVKSILGNLTPYDLIQYFKDLGIESLIREDGKVFPISLKSIDIVNTLYKNSLDYPVKYILKESIKTISYESSFIKLISNNKNIYQTKYLILSTGGNSYQFTGSEGDISSLLSPLKIKIKSFLPALSSPILEDYNMSKLAGINLTDYTMSLWRDKHRNQSKVINELNYLIPIIKKQTGVDFLPIFNKSGSLLFTHKNLSGPLILDSSRFFERGDLIVIHLTKFKTLIDFEEYLNKLFQQHPKRIVKNLFTSFDIPKKLTEFIFNNYSEEVLNSKVSDINKEIRKKILVDFYCMRFKIKELGNIESAMVSRGGVDIKEIDKKALNLKKYPNIYIAGECIDIDGDTGGYNIHFAFACAKTIIKHISKQLKNKEIKVSI